MSDKLIDEVAAILRREGFKQIAKRTSSATATLSAEKDSELVVFHVTQGSELPTRAAVPLATPARGLDVRVKASFPGIRAAIGQPPREDALRSVRIGAGGASGRPR
jgi:hypothetical protein